MSDEGPSISRTGREKRSKDEDCNGAAREVGRKPEMRVENVGVCLSFPPSSHLPHPFAAAETLLCLGLWGHALHERQVFSPVLWGMGREGRVNREV